MQSFFPLLRTRLHPVTARLQELHADILVSWLMQSGQPAEVSRKSAMIISPHQDDETLGCGGTIALKRQFGLPVSVVFLTDGQKAPIGEHSPAAVIQLRQQEARSALSILGVDSDQIHFLNQPDGELQDLSPEQQQAAIAQLIELLHRYEPEEVYVTHRHDPHPDHQAAYQLVETAIAQVQHSTELVQYPIWLFWKSPLFLRLQLRDLAGVHVVATDSVHDRKQQAIAAYASQCSTLPLSFFKRFRQPYEIFFRHRR